jgi:hypothetical protein
MELVEDKNAWCPLSHARFSLAVLFCTHKFADVQIRVDFSLYGTSQIRGRI